MASPTPKSVCISRIRLAAVLAAVGMSRQFVRRTLAGWRLPDQIDCAELIVSELVTNAVQNSGGPGAYPPSEVGVQLRLTGAGLSIEVWDRGAGSPVIAEPTLDAEGGRGLGKIVWAELALPDQEQPDQDVGTADLALMQRVLEAFPYVHTA